MTVWGRRWLRVLLMLAVWEAILAVGLTAVEIYARVTQEYRVWSLPLQKRQPYFFKLDRLKVWNRKFVEQHGEYFRDWPIPLELFDADKPTPRYLFKPNLRMAEKNGKLVDAVPGESVQRSTNSWGFRGPEFSIVKPAGVIRIVCLGASTTEGSQGDLETYPHFLQQELAQLFTGRQIEVMNAGYHGQTIDDLLDILRQKVLPLRPDIVIFYEVSNNVAWREFLGGVISCPAGACASKLYSDLYALLNRHSATFVLLAQRFGWTRQRPPPFPHEFDDSSPKPSAEHYRAVLRKIVRETRGAGHRIVLVSFITLAHEGLSVRYEDNPLLFRDLYNTRYPFTPGELGRIYDFYNRISQVVAAEFQVPFVDTATEFPRDMKYFPFDIIHFSPEGNRILARILARHLKGDVLPDLVARGSR